MDSLIFAFNAVLPIVLVVALGYFIKRIKLVTVGTAKELNKIVFRVLLPANLFLSVYKIDSLASVNLTFVLFAVVATVALFALGLIYVRFATKEYSRRGALLQAVFRSNYALIGVSLVVEIFGESGSGSAALLAAFIVPLFNILAVITLTVFEPVAEGEEKHKISVKRIVIGILKNPLALSVFTGLAVLGIRACFVRFDLSFRLSDLSPVSSVLEMLSRSATPLALVALGAQFEFSAVKEMKREIISATVVRLIFVPLLALGSAVLFFRFTGPEYAALIAAFASPVAVSSVPMAQEMRGDATLAGQIVVWTTLFSSVSLFLFIFALRALGVLV
ncbi:MAG: AEC family transporter [Clostridia bacterium]|nr:AEC family transporter [Clostridia bacterium]